MTVGLRLIKATDEDITWCLSSIFILGLLGRDTCGYLYVSSTGSNF